MRLPLLVALALSSLAFGSAGRPHATLVSSEPAANSHLAAAPTRVRLVYSEPVEGGLARVVLVSKAGTSIALRAAADPRNVNAVIAPVDSLAPGSYKVDWRVVSADGHAVTGAFSFAVGDTTLGAAAAPVAVGEPAVPDSVAAEPEPPLEDESWGPSAYGAPLIPALLRGLALGALMAAAGVLLLFRLAGPNAEQIGCPRVGRATTSLLVAAPLLLALHVVTWLINTSPDHTFDTAWAGAALGTTVGQVELWRTGLAILALWAWWLARKPRLALVFAAAALAVSGATGHSAAIQPFVAIPAKSVHLLASGVWAGGLAWLIVRPTRDSMFLFARDANRVSKLALGAVVAVAVTGFLQTLLFLPSLGDVFTSPYGWFALAKTAGFLVLVAFGAYHRQRVMPRIANSLSDADCSALRGSVRRELVVMVAVILLGGLLAYVPPPEGDEAMSPPPSASSL
jgi:copper transport protein